VGVAVARALEACGAARVQVKWPNDLVVDFRKLAGILVEMSGDLQGPSVAVIGIGVNYRLGERVLDRIDQAVVDVASCASPVPGRTELLGALLEALESALVAFDRGGFAPFREPWRALHAYHGRPVRVMPAGEAAFDAEVLDVAPDGALIVGAAGRNVVLSSAEISLRAR
jgi:BirA family biotin operon repressor/biotin-[acetyl-CoA-carboxylase] ligase